ncbi:hypothetical protein ACMFMG_010637 [Clarireedia jacksonii]
MDELNFQKLCTPTIHYRSLREQEIVTTCAAQQAIPHTLSKARPTYVHLVVPLEDHWAAVQISLCPFIIQDIPGQTFYRCHYRYTLCCSSEDREDASTRSLVENAVQTIYDAYYRPVWWNFSDEQSYTKETPGSADHEANITCTKATELQLLNYINSATKAPEDGIVLFCKPAAEVTALSGSKRRRDQSQENAYHRGKRRKSATPGSPGQETADIESNDDIELSSRVSAAEEKTGCQKTSDILAKKILDGLKNRKRAHTVNTQFIEESSIEGSRIEGSSIEQDPSKYYESQLWLQSSKLIDTAKTTAWKYRFLASCFRLVRTGQAVSNEQEVEFIGTSSLQIHRWMSAAGIINMIVNGLAEAWGEKADLVYEALAVKNYLLSTCSKWSEERRNKVVALVVEILSQADVPATDFQCSRFHPAFCISVALNREYMALTSTLRISLIGLNSYTEICHALKLGYYTQRGLLIAKDNLFRFPWESKTQLAIRGTIADHILRETQPTDSGQLNADLNDSRQEEHSSHPGPGLENELFSSATAAPVSNITQGTQLPSVENIFDASEGSTEVEHQHVASDTRGSIMDQRDYTLPMLVPAESDTTESQQLLEREESRRIPQEFTDSGHFIAQKEIWQIPQEFTDDRDFIGQEENWVQNWQIPQEFTDDRDFIGQEENWVQNWQIPQEFTDDRDFIGQEGI